MKTLSFAGAGLVVLASAFLWGASASTPSSSLPPAEADAPAQLVSSPRHGEWVTVHGAGLDQFDAWVVYPERSGPAPVVVLIHEIFGLTDWARAVADQYAAEGFLVIAPDFLSGKAPDGKGGSPAMGPDASRAAIAKLDLAEILSRLNAAASYATALPSATRAYGVVGYCWGGGIAFGWATAQPGLAAAVGFYGTAPAKETLTAVRAPILALYGGSDARVTSTMAPFRDEMARLGKPFEAEVYEGAGHAFLRQQSGQNGANLLATQKAWPRSVAFLRSALEGKTAAVLPTEGLAPVDCADCETPVALGQIALVGPM
jgi:carboxymethylenebutenolidase